MDDKVRRYIVNRSIIFENNRGFALGENPDAVQPFATWQFTEDENGKRDYYWGHYTSGKEAAAKDFEARVAEYQRDYGVAEKSVYKYYSTQRPVDIGTFPKTESGPLRIINFDARESVERGSFQAWGYLEYNAPLTEKQMNDHELRAAPGNPRLAHDQYEQRVQAVGKWEQSKRMPHSQRLTWWYSDYGIFVKKESVTALQITERLNKIERQKAKSSIAKQLEKGAEQAGKENAARPVPDPKAEKGR